MTNVGWTAKTGALGEAAIATDHGPVFIVGAGPGGLTAAYRLRQQGVPATVLEKRDRIAEWSTRIVNRVT